jgi:hypothetical protein
MALSCLSPQEGRPHSGGSGGQALGSFAEVCWMATISFRRLTSVARLPPNTRRYIVRTNAPGPRGFQSNKLYHHHNSNKPFVKNRETHPLTLNSLNPNPKSRIGSPPKLAVSRVPQADSESSGEQRVDAE